MQRGCILLYRFMKTLVRHCQYPSDFAVMRICSTMTFESCLKGQQQLLKNSRVHSTGQSRREGDSGQDNEDNNFCKRKSARHVSGDSLIANITRRNSHSPVLQGSCLPLCCPPFVATLRSARIDDNVRRSSSEFGTQYRTTHRVCLVPSKKSLLALGRHATDKPFTS